MLNASSEWKPQGMKQALICCGALLLLACGGGDAGDEDDEGDDGDGQGGDTDAAGDSTDAGSGLEAELDTCIVTVTGDAASGVEPLSYSIPTQGLYQYYLVGDGVFQGTPTANVSCSSAPGVPGPGQESNRAVFSLAFPDELWADIEIPLTGTQAGGPGVATAVLERITDPDPAPVERRNWHCSPVLGDDGTGESSWTITAIRPNQPGLANLNSVILDGEFHGVCAPTPQDPVDLAEGLVTIDVIF